MAERSFGSAPVVTNLRQMEVLIGDKSCSTRLGGEELGWRLRPLMQAGPKWR